MKDNLRVGYSIENAERYKWSSVSGDLNSERIAILEKYLVGREVLDAGCGGGAYVNFLSSKGLDVTGIDKFEMFIGKTRVRDYKGTFTIGDLTDLPFRDKSFDVSYSFDVLEHIDDIAAIQELARVTRHRVIVAVPQEDDFFIRFGLTFLHYQDQTHLRNYTDQALRVLADRVAPAQVTVFPELAVPASYLLNEMMVVEDTSGTNFAFRIFQTVTRRIRRRILRGMTFKAIHSGLVVVIDMQ